MKVSVIILLVSICSLCYCQQPDVSNNLSLPVDLSASVDNLKRAYLILMKTGNYDEKKKALKIFSNNYTNDKVIDMIVDLLDHFYDKENFTENDQIMYFDDVIAEELVKLLGKSGSKKGFHVLLKLALNASNHREDTVNEAWKAIEMIKW